MMSPNEMFLAGMATGAVATLMVIMTVRAWNDYF